MEGADAELRFRQAQDEVKGREITILQLQKRIAEVAILHRTTPHRSAPQRITGDARSALQPPSRSRRPPAPDVRRASPS